MGREQSACEWCSLSENKYGELVGPELYHESLESYSSIQVWPGETAHILVISHADRERDGYDVGLTEILYCPWCGRRLGEG